MLRFLLCKTCEPLPNIHHTDTHLNVFDSVNEKCHQMVLASVQQMDVMQYQQQEKKGLQTIIMNADLSWVGLEMTSGH